MTFVDKVSNKVTSKKYDLKTRCIRRYGQRPRFVQNIIIQGFINPWRITNIKTKQLQNTMNTC